MKDVWRCDVLWMPRINAPKLCAESSARGGGIWEVIECCESAPAIPTGEMKPVACLSSVNFPS